MDEDFKKLVKDKLDNFKIDEKTDCWNWQGSTSSNGYGSVSIKGVNYRANRLSYEYHEGDIPKDLMVLHECDNPQCVNPDHLYAGTGSDNAQDRTERTGHTRVTDATVGYIRRMYNMTEMPIKLIAKISSVTDITAYNICRGSSRKRLSILPPHLSRKQSSDYTGVSWHIRDRKWIAVVRSDYKVHNLGGFINEKRAALKVDHYRIKHNIKDNRSGKIPLNVLTISEALKYREVISNDYYLEKPITL